MLGQSGYADSREDALLDAIIGPPPGRHRADRHPAFGGRPAAG